MMWSARGAGHDHTPGRHTATMGITGGNGAPSRSPPTHAKARIRREPPAFRRVAVHSVHQLSRRMIRVTVTGSDLEGLLVEDPAASVRLLLPSPGERDPVIPKWNGNEFLRADGSRPIIRTLTPLRIRPDVLKLDLEIVIHDVGVASRWAQEVAAGEPGALSGSGRGYSIDRSARAFLLAGDETAIPAISELLEALPTETPVRVCIEVTHPEARLSLPDHPRSTVEWCDLPSDGSPGDALIHCIKDADLDPGIRVWMAGEAAAMHRIRRVYFQDRGLARADAVIRGYWKRPRP